MAKAWADVVATPEFQRLPPDRRQRARDLYFETVVAPNAPGSKAERARSLFDQYRPEDAAPLDSAADGQMTGQQLSDQIVSGALGAQRPAKTSVEFDATAGYRGSRLQRSSADQNLRAREELLGRVVEPGTGSVDREALSRQLQALDTSQPIEFTFTGGDRRLRRDPQDLAARTVDDPVSSVRQTLAAVPEQFSARAANIGLAAEELGARPARFIGAGDGIDTQRGLTAGQQQAEMVSRQAADAKRKAVAEAVDRYQKALPETKRWSAAGIAQAVAQSAPDTLAAILAGTFGGPALGGAMMFAAAAPEEYGRRRGEGKSPIDSLQSAIVSGAAESIGEALPLRYFIGQIRRGGAKAASNWLTRYSQGAIAEGPSEMLTEAVNMAYGAGILNDDMTLNEAIDEVLFAGATGAGMGVGVQAGIDAGKSTQGAYQSGSRALAARSLWKEAGASDAVSDAAATAAENRAFREGREVTARDAVEAIDDIPDAELQATSPRYRRLRQDLDEKTVKELMKRDAQKVAPAAQPQAEPRQTATQSGQRQLTATAQALSAAEAGAAAPQTDPDVAARPDAARRNLESMRAAQTDAAAEQQLFGEPDAQPAAVAGEASEGRSDQPVSGGLDPAGIAPAGEREQGGSDIAPTSDAGMGQIAPVRDGQPEQDAALTYPAEPLGAEAESQPPASEAGDTGVSPGQVGAVPRQARRRKPPKPAKTAEELGERGRRSLLRTIKNNGGLNLNDIADITGEKGRAAVRMAPGLFRRDGRGVDDIATVLHESGFISDEDYNSVDGGVQAARDLIQGAIRGQPVVSQDYAEEYSALRQAARDEIVDAAEAVGVEPERLDDLMTAGLDASDAANVLDYDLLDRIRQADEDAFERAAVQHENDDAALMQWAQEWANDQDSANTGQGAEADRGGTRDSGAREARETTGQSGQRAVDGREARREDQEPQGVGEDVTQDLFGAVPREPAVDVERRRRAQLERERQRAAPAPESFALTGSDRDADVAAAAGQQALFSGYEGAGGRKAGTRSGDTQPAAALPRYESRTELVESGTTRIGVSHIKAPQDLADAAADLAKLANERFVALVTDKDGKVLAAIGNNRGTVDGASVYPRTVVAETVGIDGAANIWFAHNHPSGVPTISRADARITERLVDVFRGTRIKPMGMIAVGAEMDGTRSWEFTGPGVPRVSGATTGGKGANVSILERVYTKTGKLGPAITKPRDAAEVLMGIAGDQPGILLLDTQNTPVAFVPWSAERAGKMRDTGALDDLYEAVAISNAGAAIIANPNDSYNEKQILNLGAGLQRGGMEVRVLDAISYSTDGSKPTVSLADTGRPTAGDTFFSMGADSASSTIFELRAALEEKFSKTGIAKLIDSGLVRIVQSQSDLPAHIRNAIERAGTEAAPRAIYFRGDGNNPAQAFIIADRVSAEAAPGILLHEIGEHHNLKAMIGDKSYADLLARVRRGRKLDPAIRAAWAQVAQSYTHLEEGSDAFVREVIAHVAEGADLSKPGWVRDLINKVRAFLWKLGLMKNLNAEDIRQMIVRSLRQVMSDRQISVYPGDVAFALSGQTDTPAFRRWFGNSVVTHNGKPMKDGGRPLVVYHGTRADFTEFSRAFAGSGMSGEARDGFFFAPDPAEASGYAAGEAPGGRVVPAYLSLQNPMDLAYSEHGIDDIIEADSDVAEYLRRAQGLVSRMRGKDGLIIRDIGGRKGNDLYVALHPNQIKSSIGNRGTFDPADPRIDFSLGGAQPADPTPVRDFREANRKLRGDKPLWDKMKQSAQRWMTAPGLFPKDAFDENRFREQGIRMTDFSVRARVAAFERGVKNAYGKSWSGLGQARQKVLANALHGNIDASIPESVKLPILAMRSYIDGLSREYASILERQIDALVAQGEPGAEGRAELRNKILGNIGTYLNRSYKAFDDPNWWKKVTDQTIDAARRYLVEGYIEQGASRQEAERLAENVLHQLKTGTAVDSLQQFIAEGKVGAKDLSVLMRRKVIAPEIRELLGEYKDPRILFAKSATKMGALVSNQYFLERIREIGMGAFLWEKNDPARPPEARTEIAGEKSDTYSPLNGLYTTPEIAQAFGDTFKPIDFGWFAPVIRANGMIKMGKTVLSPTTAMRNWQSAMFFSLANGHFDPRKLNDSWDLVRARWKDDAEAQAYVLKLVGLGVVGDGANAREAMRLMEDANFEGLFGALSTRLQSRGYGKAASAAEKAGEGSQWTLEMAQGFYRFGDDFWKVLGFEHEKASWMKAGMTEAKAERQAAERVINTYPTYSMQGRLVRLLSRFPLLASFPTFTAEIIRTSVNMAKYTAQDLRSTNPAIRAMGMKRAVGMTMVSGLFYGLAMMTRAMFDVDDEEEEAVRIMAPPWQKNSTFVYSGRNDKGELEYFDMTFLDPYGFWKRPLTAMVGNPLSPKWRGELASGLADMLSPFFDTDIAFGGISELIANKKASGGAIYNDADVEAGNYTKVAGDVAEHLRKTLQPGIAGNVERTWLAARGMKRSSGQPYNLKDEALAWLGWRATTQDTRTALRFRAYDFTDTLRGASAGLNRTLRDPNKVSAGDIKTAVENAKKAREAAYTEMRLVVGAARTAGMTDQQIGMLLRAGQISLENVQALLDDERPIPPIKLTNEKASAMERSFAAIGQEERAEGVRDRFEEAQRYIYDDKE